jgi:hypothetical protein
VNSSEYNESSIKRRKVLLDFDVINNWHIELEKMNKCKEGRKFVYHDSFIRLLGYKRVYFYLPYILNENIKRARAVNTLPSILNYSRICRRINRLDTKINDYCKTSLDMMIIL